MQIASDRPSDLARAPLAIRRVDAIPVALPLTKPVKMAAETVTHARNILVRIEARRRHGGLGRGGLRADHDRRHHRGPRRRRARASRAAAPRRGRLDASRADEAPQGRALRQHRRAFRGGDGIARSRRTIGRRAGDRSHRRCGQARGRAHVAGRQCDAGPGRRGGAGAPRRRHPLLQAQGRRQAARHRNRDRHRGA